MSNEVRSQRAPLGRTSVSSPALGQSAPASPSKSFSGPMMRSGLGVGGASSSIERSSGIRGIAPVRMTAVNNPDSDSMRHIEYLASAELRGRGSPSEGYDMASKYAADLMKKYGLEGPNAADPSGNPHFQTFEMMGIDVGLAAESGLHIHKQTRLGPELFQYGYYLDHTTTKEERELIDRLHGRIANRMNIAPAANTVQNVVGVVRGTGPRKDEYIVLMAHLDHVGARGNTIYYGADDNASGSGTLLSTLPQLQELQKAGKLDRSVILLLTAAEEKGLVGSRYFVKHPLPGIPLSAIKGCYNNDMLGRWELDRMSLGVGSRKTNFMADLTLQANENLGERKFTTVNRDIDQYERQQDGYNFSAAGIPTVYPMEGLSNPKGGGDLHQDYHQPTDTADKIVRDNGGEKPRRFRDLTVEVARLASNAKIDANGGLVT